MNKKLLYWSIEINLILWLGVLGLSNFENEAAMLRTMAIIGTLFSAILQHWAYYKIRNKLD